MAGRPAGDNRYLKRRGNRWWVQIAVPKNLQDRYGRVFQKSLGTSDISEARHLRWAHVYSRQNAFKRALGKSDWSAEEIEVFAQKKYAEIVAMERIDASVGVEEALDIVISELSWELQRGVYDETFVIEGEKITPRDPDIDTLTEETGVIPSHEKRREAQEAFLRAKIEAYLALSKRIKGAQVDPVPVFNTAGGITKVPTVVPDSSSFPLNEAMAQFLNARGESWTRKTYGQTNTSLRLFCDHMGEATELSKATRLDATKWREKMRRLHPRWASSSTSQGLSLDQLLERFGQGPDSLSDKTLSRHLSAVHSMFKWAIDAGHFEGANPVTVGGSGGSRSEQRYKRGTFTDEEVIKIFADLRFETQPKQHRHSNARSWIALLGAYSGARLEEVCGLHSTDVKQESGIWFMDLKETNRQLKTLSAYRRVPLHRNIVEIGFLDYVAACGDKWLFPSLGEPNVDGRRGTYLGKAFSGYCRKLQIEKPLLGYHYWRTTVATKLENAKVPELDAARLMGHRFKTMSYGLYSGGPDLAQVQKTVEQISYPGLILSVA